MPAQPGADSAWAVPEIPATAGAHSSATIAPFAKRPAFKSAAFLAMDSPAGFGQLKIGVIMGGGVRCQVARLTGSDML
ncbi:hypothetical protein GCM10023193_80340 [Planotetraspora kaengkrachanensis]|uniref:Uncharacterized protein n=1 Tax=Planotetraspora kaengkrachanensis TaxID=575193 RepID=A0A8J3Q162_9ACTN|nr:hypothetical protein Pka01_79520 [Planotetraspora kaengkrachanensis]